MYIVVTPKCNKPLLKTNCLRSADKFAKQGKSRAIFDNQTGKELTCGFIGVNLKDYNSKIAKKVV